MGVIFRLSAIPGSRVPGRFGNLGHFVSYAVLAALLYSAARRAGSGITRGAAIAILVASLYGVTDEIHQAFVPGRIPDVADWAIDTLGAAAAAAVPLVRRHARSTKAARRRPS